LPELLTVHESTLMFWSFSFEDVPYLSTEISIPAKPHLSAMQLLKVISRVNVLLSKTCGENPESNILTADESETEQFELLRVNSKPLPP